MECILNPPFHSNKFPLLLQYLSAFYPPFPLSFPRTSPPPAIYPVIPDAIRNPDSYHGQLTCPCCIPSWPRNCTLSPQLKNLHHSIFRNTKKTGVHSTSYLTFKTFHYFLPATMREILYFSNPLIYSTLSS